VKTNLRLNKDKFSEFKLLTAKNSSDSITSGSNLSVFSKYNSGSYDFGSPRRSIVIPKVQRKRTLELTLIEDVLEALSIQVQNIY
jgi:hypothetical protein